MNTSVTDIMERLKARGFSVRLVGEAVKVAGPEKPDPETQGLLDELRKRKTEVRAMLSESDPVVPVEAWYPIFHELHKKVVVETRNFNYILLKQHNSGLYQQIKAKENEIDAIQDARLSGVMQKMREWRELVLRAYFEQQAVERKSA